MNFNKKSVLNVMAWIFGVAFIVLGAMVFAGGGFLMSFIFILMGIVFLPVVGKVLRKKFSFIFSWKLKSVVIVVLVILLFLTPDAVGNYGETFIEKGDADVDLLVEYTVDLTEVLNSYKEAEIQTLAAYRIEFDTMSYEDYIVFTDEVIEKWDATEKLATSFVDKYKPYSIAYKNSFFLVAHAASLGRDDETFDEMAGIVMNPSNELDPMNRIEHHDSVYNNKYSGKNRDKLWLEVEATVLDNPQITLIEAIEMHFGPGAGDRKKLVKEHQAVMAPIWKDEIEYYGKMENGARVIANGSKVIVFVGGVYLTGGLAGVIEGGALNATLVTAEGVDLILETGETVSIVGFGNADGPPMIKTARGLLKPLTLIGSIKGLATDPRAMEELAGKLLNVQGLGSDALDLVLSIEGDRLKFKEQPPKKALPSDEAFKLLQERYATITFTEYSEIRNLQIEQWKEDRAKEEAETKIKEESLQQMKDDAAAKKAKEDAVIRKANAEQKGYMPTYDDGITPTNDYDADMQAEILRLQQIEEDKAEAERLEAESAEVERLKKEQEEADAQELRDAEAAAAAAVEKVSAAIDEQENAYLLSHPEEITDCGRCQSIGGWCTTTQGVEGWRCTF